MLEMPEQPLPLLLWRATHRSTGMRSEDSDPPDVLRAVQQNCPWCSTKTVIKQSGVREFEFLGSDITRSACPLCGWFGEEQLDLDGESCLEFAPWECTYVVAQLKAFDYADAAVATANLAAT